MAITLRGNSQRIIQIYREALELAPTCGIDNVLGGGGSSGHNGKGMLRALKILESKYVLAEEIQDAEICRILQALEAERLKAAK